MRRAMSGCTRKSKNEDRKIVAACSMIGEWFFFLV
jgi:hypothetical protein